MHTKNHTLFIFVYVYLYLVYEPRMFKGILKTEKKTELEYIKSNSWMAHFSLAPELFDKRADVTHNVRQYGIQAVFYCRLCGVIVQFKLQTRDCGMVIYQIYIASFVCFVNVLVFTLRHGGV